MKKNEKKSNKKKKKIQPVIKKFEQNWIVKSDFPMN